MHFSTFGLLNMQFQNSQTFAEQLDQNDELRSFRNRFHFPKHHGNDVIYFCGNSLGLQPKTTRAYVEQELSDWENFGVEGHFIAKNPWFPYHEFVRNNMAELAGALPAETVVMNSLSVNIHLMLATFYRPTKERYKILCEVAAFPSDQYALQSQAMLHGLDPEKTIVELKPRPGEFTIRHEDVISTIEQLGNSLALVFIGNVNYYTGQCFHIKEIAESGHKAGAYVGFDLAHGAGNLELKLHQDDVDFAVWCSYKYLNAGPGGVAAAFVHEKHVKNTDLFRLAGWWGNDPASRFTMPGKFVPVQTADAWQLSNAPVLPMAALRASLEIFAEAGIKKLVWKRKVLHSFMRFMISEAIRNSGSENAVLIITPEKENEQGAQLSMLCKRNGKQIHKHLTDHGVIADWREPEVLRMAAVPLYNSFTDVYTFGKLFEDALNKYRE